MESSLSMEACVTVEACITDEAHVPLEACLTVLDYYQFAIIFHPTYRKIRFFDQL